LAQTISQLRQGIANGSYQCFKPHSGEIEVNKISFVARVGYLDNSLLTFDISEFSRQEKKE
jgi:hypothetical protein